jgi:hypothetical protein
LGIQDPRKVLGFSIYLQKRPPDFEAERASGMGIRLSGALAAKQTWVFGIG